jgi:hypothetical protein
LCIGDGILALAFWLFCAFIIKASKKSLQNDEMPLPFCHRIVVVDYFGDWHFGIGILAFLCLYNQGFEKEFAK